MTEQLGAADQPEENSRNRRNHREKGGAKAEGKETFRALFNAHAVVNMGKVKQRHHNRTQSENVEHVFGNERLCR